MREGIVTALAKPNGTNSIKEPPMARGRTPGDRVPRLDLVPTPLLEQLGCLPNPWRT